MVKRGVVTDLVRHSVRGLPVNKKKPALKTFQVRYVATVRGVLEVEASSEDDAKALAEETGAEFATCEQTDFEALSVKEVHR